MVTSFTCEAVFDAIIASGKTPIQLDINLDFSFNIENIKERFHSGAYILLLQNTLGQVAIDPKKIKKLIDHGCFVISDNSLAYGTKINDLDVINIGHVSLESYEVSKTITCGWGGALIIKNTPKSLKENLLKKYSLISELPLFQSAFEYFQMAISRKFIRKYNPLAFMLWYFFYTTFIFKKSHIARKKLNKNIFKINKYTKKLILLSASEKEEIFSKTNQNYRKIDKLRQNLGLKTIQQNTKLKPNFIVSPRYPIILRKPFNSALDKLFVKNKIDVGRWFSEIPNSNTTKNNNLKNTIFLNSHIVNIPTHHSLKEEDFKRIEKLFIDMANNGF